VKLFPDQQAQFVAANPRMFAPVKGGWGKRGGTNVLLKAASQSRVREALAAAWRNTAGKGLIATEAAAVPKPAKKRRG
jgi:hypothetical protein